MAEVYAVRQLVHSAGVLSPAHEVGMCVVPPTGNVGGIESIGKSTARMTSRTAGSLGTRTVASKSPFAVVVKEITESGTTETEYWQNDCKSEERVVGHTGLNSCDFRHAPRVTLVVDY